jgi:hypothetical protein
MQFLDFVLHIWPKEPRELIESCFAFIFVVHQPSTISELLLKLAFNTHKLQPTEEAL